MLPNYYRKIISGQVLLQKVRDYNRKIIINHMGMVTRHEIERNEMGNRVTKSSMILKNITGVKVQRADGSWLLQNNLRCALLVSEKYYITKILSNRSLTKVFYLQVRTFSSNYFKRLVYLASHINRSFYYSKLQVLPKKERSSLPTNLSWRACASLLF